jgi:ABC-type multidrug transport system fused ATPase/permease subunit
MMWRAPSFVNDMYEKRKRLIVENMMQKKLAKISFTANTMTADECRHQRHQTHYIEMIYHCMNSVGELFNMIITTFMFFNANVGFFNAVCIAIVVCGAQYGLMKFDKHNNDSSADRKKRRERHDLMGETFHNIKMIKLFGWETLMGGRIKEQRKKDREDGEKRRNRNWISGYLHRLQRFSTPIIVYVAYSYSGKTISLAFLNLAQTYIGRL